MTSTLQGGPGYPGRAADDLARRSLGRHRAFATFLLVLMAALTLASYALPDGLGAEFLQAASKAGFVGGLADWFAVTALFRHPLGIPIPHTAIIPNQKVRLGRALGRFVANHVFTQAEVGQTLARIDLPGILGRFLTDPAATRPAAEAIAGMMPRLLATIEDGRARKVLGRLIPRLLGGPEAGRIVARAMRGMMEGGRHQEVFGFIIGQLKTILTESEEAIQHAIEERVREQGGRLVGWALGASIARRVIGLIATELAKMEPDGSELRLAFDEWMRREIQKIEDEPARAAEIGLALKRAMTHASIQAWIWDIWSRARVAMEADAARPNGRTVAVIESAMGNLGMMLETDPGARLRVQRAAEGVLVNLLPTGQMKISDFIADVVAKWDAETIVDRLELRVGRDLQYVRINGTIVGFLAGGVVWALLRAIFGHVSF